MSCRSTARLACFLTLCALWGPIPSSGPLAAQSDDNIGIALAVVGGALIGGFLLVPVPDFEVNIEGDAFRGGDVNAQIRDHEGGLVVVKGGFFGGHEAGRLTSLDDSGIQLTGINGDKQIDAGRVRSVHDLESAAARFQKLRQRSAIFAAGGAVGLYLLYKDEPSSASRTLFLADAALFGAFAAYLAVRPSGAERELQSRSTRMSAFPTVNRMDDGRLGLGVHARWVF